MTSAVPQHSTPSPVEVLPLHTSDGDVESQQQRLVCDVSALRGDSSSILSNLSSSDVIAFIENDVYKRKVVVQRMDGTHVASFGIPVDVSSSTLAKEAQRKNNNYNQAGNTDEQWGEGYDNQILCWASFSKKRNHDSNNNLSSGGGGRKMLCVLGNPNTLFVFDVLGDTAILATANNIKSSAQSKSQGKGNNDDQGDDDDAGGGPGGHTISLPFRASSIYPIPSGGLMLVRTPAEEDYVAVMEAAQSANSVANTSANSGGATGVGAASSSSSIGGGNNNNDPPGPPPSALGMSLPATPRRQSLPKNEDDDELSLEHGPPDPLRLGVAGGASDNGFGYGAAGLLPCLFTLRHPLDEIRPVALTSTTAAALDNYDIEEEEHVNEMVVEPESDIDHLHKFDLFTDVNETLVHVSSPRLFHHPAMNSRDTATPPMICVTYNRTLSRHTIWSLSKSNSVVEDVPLWKSTGRGAWREQQKEDDAVMVEKTQQQDNNNETNGVGSNDSSHSGNNSSSEGVAPAVVSSFSDIHPDFTLTCIFEEDEINDPMDEDAGDNNQLAGGDGLVETITVKESARENSSSLSLRYRRNVFLATDQVGNGDLILCIFMPNDDSKKQQRNKVENDSVVEPAILRCYSLHLSSSIDSVSHVRDVACSSAQPVQSIPLPLKPFSSAVDKGASRTSSRFQEEDVNTLANDILVLQNYNDVGDESTRLRLFRAGTSHIVDFTLPKSMLDSTTLKGYHYAGLDNAVGNRVDIKLVKAKEEGGFNSSVMTKIVRSEVTLVVHASPVTETALSAIASALVSDNMDEDTNSLPLLIRADCARLLQQIGLSSDNTNDYTCLPSGVEDIAWYTLSIILLELLLLGKKSNGSHQHGLETTDSSHQLSAWEELLHSDFHLAFSEGEGKLLFDTNPVAATPRQDASALLECYGDELSSIESAEKIIQEDKLLDVKKCIFDSLHLLHEDSRLVKSRGNSWTRRLGSFLYQVSETMSPLMLDFQDHYQRYLLGHNYFSTPLIPAEIPEMNRSRLSSFSLPPCIMTWIDTTLQSDLISKDVEDLGTASYSDLVESGLNGTCSTSWMVIRLFTALFDKNVTWQRMRDRETVMTMLDEGVYHPIQLQEELPMSVCLILLEALSRCRLDPPQIDSSDFYWPCAAYDLVGRNDLAELLAQSLSICEEKDSEGSSYSGEGSDAQLGEASLSDPDKDGLAALEDFSSMIFPDDNRIKEATRLLRSSRPLFLRVPRPVELSDHEYERSKQDKLLLLCRRSIATPLGRGMLTLGTHRMLSSDQLLIPDIVLAGRVPPTNSTLALDMSSCPPNFRIWPEFHNGVSAGLRLPEASCDGGKTITRTWIKFNRPAQNNPGSNNNANQNPPSYAHGGFLMALGLRGHLAALNTSDLTDYLSQGTITTTVGVFLGMAANKRGSCDPGVSKMLCLHVPSLLPPSFIPMDLASTVQAAAVAGIGLLYQKSSHRLMTEFLLNEIGRQPTKDQNTNDRESFALVCGLSLGLINLEKGKSTVSGLEDLKIEERLHRYISGVGADNEFQNSPSPFQNGHQAEGDRNARIHESDLLNRDITAPGSILALGLMYIKSGNVSIASILKLPDTHFLLDYIRPDHLALRVLAKSLILWNAEPTAAWIDSQVPSVVKTSVEFMRKAAIRAVSLASMDEEMDGSDDQTQPKSDVADFDPQAVRQANAFIIAGACLSIGIRYAGSANREAAAAIIQRVLWFLELRDNKDVTSQVQRPDITTLTTCLCTSAISLAMVMAGTGDLDSFRLFRALRWNCDDSVSYGTHMIYGAAIGLLFLGGGKRTLGSSPEDVAMLIAAFFPHYPILSSDNQYHLQALRHMYVLASYNRILESVDVDSREKVCIPIELVLPRSNQCVQTSTPFLVANDSDFAELRTRSDRYYPIVLKTGDRNNGGIVSPIFVKRKPGHLSYLQDPNALRSLSIQAGSTNSESFLKSIKMLSDDSVLASFVKYFCKAESKHKGSSNPEMPIEARSGFIRYCNLVANDCVQEGKSETLPLHLTLYRWLHLTDGSHSVNDIWDLRILRTYTKRKGRPVDDTLQHVNLVSGELITLVCEHIDGTLESATSLIMDESTQLMPTEKVWYELPLQLASPNTFSSKQ
ncbi:hypothetical protein ACHAWC_011170 [Mediolabrus comicus]